MGTSQSQSDRQDVDDDELGTDIDAGPGVIKRIPIEMKPRGRLGLRSGGRSLSKPKGSSSLRSALSVEVAENPEVERVYKEFEMYRMNHENEVANIIKKEQKLETENRRLKAELQVSLFVDITKLKTCCH
jgi:nephrocystin-3